MTVLLYDLEGYTFESVVASNQFKPQTIKLTQTAASDFSNFHPTLIDELPSNQKPFPTPRQLYFHSINSQNSLNRSPHVHATPTPVFSLGLLWELEFQRIFSSLSLMSID
jgi:hypothetical protein